VAQWKNDRQANGAPIWAPALVNQEPSAANRNAMFNNTTANAYMDGVTQGVVAIKGSDLDATGIIGVSVTASGNGYTQQPTATIDGDGTGAEASVLAKVNAMTINAAGTGGSYVPGETIAVTGGTGDAAKATVTATELRTVTIVDGGEGYANDDVVTLDGGQGTAATFTVTTGAADTVVASLALTTRGIYTVNPELSGATTTSANTEASSGLVVNVTTRVHTLTMIDDGSYSALPTLAGAATSGSATGTGLTVNLTIGVEQVLVSNTGADYTSANVVFGGTGGTGTTGDVLLSPGRAGVAQPGWVLRTEGSGGRAGRVQYETLVANKNIRDPE